LGHATTVEGSRHVRLDQIDPATVGGLTEAEADARLQPMAGELLELQELIYAAETHGVLVILQGMDAAGKDVTIRHVFMSANPESMRVKHFSHMTDEEEKHHFLWRAHLQTPGRGELVIFDRSYYEQVVLPQVQPDQDGQDGDADRVPERLDDIRHFERLLQHGGLLVFKFFLHVGKDEQERRLIERMENIETAWKISPRDWTARRSWDPYMTAYETTMNATATTDAPWYVVPADHQWFHNLVVLETLVERLRPYRDGWIEARNRRGEQEREEAREEAPEGVGA